MILDKQTMRSTRICSIILLLVIVMHSHVFCTNKPIDTYEIIHEGERYRVYLDESNNKCLWTGNAPFCFISGRCPPGMATMKTDKFGDGAYCWVGSKVYCCLLSTNSN